MKLLFKYLKPYALLVILCIVFQLGRVYGELQLPTVMSQMVTVGIQQNGFEATSPHVLRNEDMELLSSFMTDDDKEAFTSAYSTQKDTSVRNNLEPDSKEIDRIYVTSCYAILQCYREQNHISGDTNISDIYLNRSSLIAADASVKDGFINEAQDLYLHTSVTKQTSIAFSKFIYEQLGGDTHEFQMDYIRSAAKDMVMYLIFILSCHLFLGFCAIKTATGVAADIRNDLFIKTISFSNTEFDHLSVASIITRCTNDIQQILSLLITTLRLFLFAITMSIGALIMAIRTSLQLSWITGLTVVILLAIIGTLNGLVIPKYKIIQRIIDRINQISRESLKGLLVIRAFRNEKYTENLFDKANSDLRDKSLFTQRTLALMSPAMTLLMNLCTILILWMGSSAIAASTLPLGDLLAYIQYSSHVVLSFNALAMIFTIFPRAIVSADRIGEVLHTNTQIKDAPGCENLTDFDGKIEFRNVSYTYGESKRDALYNLSFTIEPHKTTAIIGSTGAGKTTLVNLIVRLYDSASGEILLDGTDIRKISLKSLRDNISFTPQKSILLQGDFASNIRVGRNTATDEEIINALETAQLKDFVLRSEKGIYTDISQSGINLSGGQKQRVAIARSIVKHAPVYIFDDSFSALDAKTDHNLRKALRESLKNSTIIIVAQRISTIIDADQIIVLDEGEIVGIGTHNDLIKSCRTYKEIVESQIAKGEG